MSDAPHITRCHPPLGIPSEQGRDTRARAWMYVFECWQARRGDPHDLTNELTMDVTKNGPQTTEREKT
jgi:hypothetical protein